VLAAANGTALNWGADCYDACGGAGGCHTFCGRGNACCRFGSVEDPPECGGILAWGSLSYHTCVVPTNPVYRIEADADEGVRNWGEDCLDRCGNVSGYCPDFCGTGNVCCRWSSPYDAPECAGIVRWGAKDRHTCVAVALPLYKLALAPPNGTAVTNWAQPCFAKCGNKSGFCEDVCGTGNACCRWARPFQPPECGGILHWGLKHTHTCVAPVRLHYGLEPAPPGVSHWGQGCFDECGGAGYCQEHCGLGNACCRFEAAGDPPECSGIGAWGAKNRYTCVAPASPAFVTAKAPEGREVAHWGDECMSACNNSGFCRGFCGLGNACCLFGEASDPLECQGILQWGSKDRYTCVAPASVAFELAPKPLGAQVEHWAEDCWILCGERGGACPQFCGKGNACCRFGSTQDPAECRGILDWGSKEQHTCVRPTAPYLYVNHFAEDCWTPCKGAGFCDSWCGQGNACCRFGNADDPQECKSVAFWPTHDTHTCVKAHGHLGVPAAPEPGSCRPGEDKDAAGKCAPASSSTLMTFYLYQAAPDEYPSLQNVNLFNLQGALMYLHRRVVTACPRVGDTTRLIRYVVTVRNTNELFTSTGRQFAPYVMFDQGMCSNSSAGCQGDYDKYGYVVGCQKASNDDPAYGNYEDAVFYSLPGGGDGERGECLTPVGTRGCTWKAEYAGELRLDEITGIVDDASFCKRGSVEYNETLDRGSGVQFWDSRRNATACSRRVRYIKELFSNRYPYYPSDLGQPLCSH